MEAIKVLGVTTTSSPGPILSALRATSSANVPLAKAIDPTSGAEHDYGVNAK